MGRYNSFHYFPFLSIYLLKYCGLLLFKCIFQFKKQSHLKIIKGNLLFFFIKHILHGLEYYEERHRLFLFKIYKKLNAICDKNCKIQERVKHLSFLKCSNNILEVVILKRSWLTFSAELEFKMLSYIYVCTFMFYILPRFPQKIIKGSLNTFVRPFKLSKNLFKSYA